MNKNEKGFSVVEVLIIGVMVGLISVAGWYIWSKKQTKSPTATSQSTTIQSGNQTISSEKSLDHYQSKKYSVGFAYPRGWVVGESNPTSTELFSVHVSPRVNKSTANMDQASIEKYKNDLALHFTYLSKDYYQGFAKDNYFKPVKVLGDIIIGEKQLKLVTRDTGGNSNIIFADCNSTGTSCNHYIDYGDDKYGSIEIASVVQNRLYLTTVDTSSDVYKQLVEVASSIKR